MICSIHHRNRGSALVFVLMVVIALMALGVVLLSRSGRGDTQAAPIPTPVELYTTPTESATTDDVTTGTEATTPPEIPEPVTPELTPVNFPPPPPPISTPDNRNLPPEG